MTRLLGHYLILYFPKGCLFLFTSFLPSFLYHKNNTVIENCLIISWCYRERRKLPNDTEKSETKLNMIEKNELEMFDEGTKPRFETPGSLEKRNHRLSRVENLTFPL